MKAESNFGVPVENKPANFVVEKTTETTDVIGERPNQEALNVQIFKNIDVAIDKAHEIIARIGNDRLYPGDTRNSGLGKVVAKVEMYFSDRAGNTGGRSMDEKISRMVQAVRDQLAVDHDVDLDQKTEDRKMSKELDSTYPKSAILRRLAQSRKLFSIENPRAVELKNALIQEAELEEYKKS